MADLSTTYLGLELKNPVIIGSSGLTSTVKAIKECADNGAGAVVMKSLFEEQIIAETKKDTSAADMDMHPEAWNYVMNSTREHNIDNYLNLLKEAKSKVDIPVIASINCVSTGSWTEYATDFEKAGADALELNIFLPNIKPEFNSKELEDRYISIVREVRKQTKLPIAVKIGSQFTNPGRMIRLLAAENIQGLVLFNRFSRITIDINKEELVAGKSLSHPGEVTEPLKWIGLFSGETNKDFCGTTGVHGADDIIRLILAGANAVEIVSMFYEKGIGHIKQVLSDLSSWMDSKGYSKLEDFRGKLSASNANLDEIYSRVQFMRYILDA